MSVFIIYVDRWQVKTSSYVYVDLSAKGGRMNVEGHLWFYKSV